MLSAMKKIVFIFVLIAQPLLADVKGRDGRVIDCYCTDREGARVELGQEICLFVDGRAFMARCEMSLNNPMWRETGDSCLSSNARELGTTPLFTPIPVSGG